MEKNLEKSLKRYLKRKVKITLSFIVAFLLGSLSAYGDIQVKYENSEIKFYRDNIDITNEIKKLGTIEGDSASGFTWTINGEISEQIKIDSSIKNISFNIINNGKIISSSSSGNGIYNFNPATKNIENNGTISGSSTGGEGAGNGISNDGTIENIINNGRISGSGNTDGTILSNISGNGISNYNNQGTSKIKNITNNGIISGEFVSISDDTYYSGNGISNKGTINSIINSGRIKGSTTYAIYSGNGIYNETSTIGDIVNIGAISGASEGFSSGNGIYNYGSIIKNITNNGVISGTSSEKNDSGNGICNEDRTINNIKNYGIIAGSDKAINNSGTITNQNNYGLLIDGAGKDTQKITAGVGGEQEVPVEFNDDGSVKTTEKRFIINGAEGEKALALNSSDLKNKITGNYFNETENKYTNLLINVVGDGDNSLNIDNDFNISKSTINGYKDAVTFSDGEKTFTGDSVTINAGENAFLGSSSNDNINLSNGSTVNGNINLGEGEDKITFDTSALNGDITADKDIITFDKSQINGNITSSKGKIIISGGENTLFNTGSSMINGNITLTDGEISIADGTQINGKIELNGNIATIWLSENQKVNEKITINATEKILGLNYNINDSDKLNSVNEQLNGNGFAGIYLADGGNDNVDLRGITNLSTITGGKGNDIFVVSPDNLSNIFINGNADNSANGTLGDILKLTTVVDSTTSVMLFKNVNSVETLQLADINGNDLNINNSIPLAGSSLTFKNYVGGDKDDSFTVSIENFEKLSLIDGGKNGTAGDTLTINGEKDNTEIFLNKTAGIENFTITASENKYTERNTININDWDYLKSNKDKISIIFEKQARNNSIKGSKESIGNLKNITGYGNGYSTGVILTDNISDKNVSDKGTANEDYNFISKLNKVTDLYLANGDNYVDVNKIIETNSETNSDIQYIGLDNTSGNNSGTNYFKISSDNLKKIQISLDGSTSTEDTLEITDTFENKPMSRFPTRIEKLVLSGEGNNILIDSTLVGYKGYPKFNEIIGKDGGTNGNTFTINDRYPDDRILGVKIEGGSSENDTLKIDTENIRLSGNYDTLEKVLINKTGIENLVLGNADNTIDFTYTDKDDPSKNLKDFKNITSGNGNDKFTVSVDNIGSMKINGGADGNKNPYSDNDTLKLSGALDNTISGKENILSGVSNIENLELDDGENILNLENVGFTNITGGTGTDIFKSTSSGLNGKTLSGGAGQDSLEMKDSFDNTTVNPFTKAEGIETLKLADVTGNIVDIDKLTDFTTITGGNQGDSFTIGNSAKLGITINGGTGTDSLTLDTVVDNTSKDDLKNISSIEKLTFNAKGNNLSFADTDKNNFTSLSFGNNSTGNAVALNNLNEKEIIFGNSSGNTVTIADSSNKFNHKITGAEKIELAEGNSKWTFADGSLITGKTELNLNGNNLDFTDSQGKGNVGLDGTNLKINDVSFVGADSRVTVSNGTIKIGFDNTVTFKDGVNTEFKLSSDGKIGFGDKLTFETYSFINKIGSDLKVTVKKWEDYFTDKDDDRLVYAGRYDEALKKYNTQGNEALTEAFNIFGEKTVVDYIVNNANPKLLYYSDKGSYKVLVAEKGEDILIKTSETEADKNTKLTFSNISSTGKITIGVTEGNNEITFGSGEDSSVSIKGENGIDFSSSTTDLTVNIAGEKINEVSKIVGNDRDNIINLSGNQISIDKIELGTGENTIKISDVSNITKFGSITAKAQGKNILEISNAIEKSESGKLISLLNSDIKGISKVELGDGNDISVNSKYSYSGKVNLNSNNKVEALNGGVLNSLNFAGDNNIVTLNGGSAEGDLTFAGNNNQTVLNSGTLTGTLDFGKGTGNIFTVNTGNEFNYKVKDADTISLNSSKEWTFGNGAKISGDTKIDLNGNTALLSTTSNGTTVTLNRDFAEGNVTFSNGTIKITLNQNTDFSNGVNTKLTLADGGLTGDAKLQTYAFLNVNADKTINVIDWKTLSGDETVTDTHKIIYNNTIKKFNEDEIYGVLTVWEKDSIVSWIKKNGEVLEDHTVESNKGEYNGIVSSGTITIDTDKGGKLEDLDIKDLSSKDVVIGNNTTDGDGKVDFTGSTAVSGTVTNNSKEDVDIIFGGKTEIGKIDSSSSEGTTDIIINNFGDKFVSGDIIFNDKEFNDKNNKLDIEDSSNIDKIGTITGNVDIIIDNVGDKSDGFNNVLAGADRGYNDKKDNNSITVNNSANVNITNKYDGTLTFNGQENNITVGNSIGTLITGAGKDNITLESNVGSLNTGSNDDIINLNVNKFADKVIEVNLDGGDGNDIFNIISLKTEKSVNENSDKQPEKSLTGKINSLETINLKTDIGFASDLKITGTNEIKLNGNNLFVDVDYTKKADDKVIGHALYDNGIKVDNSTGKVMIDTAKANDGTIISLGTAGNKTEFASTDKEHLLESGSSNHHIEMIDGDIVVKVNEHIMGDSETGAIKYAHLDKIYQSIVSADKIKEMSDTTTLLNKTKDEAVKAQLEFYGKIYHSTPYAYSNDVSKKSADLITESIMNLKVMPEYKHWVFGGSIAGQEADSDSNFYGSNHYNGIDIGKNEVSADTNIYGAYAFGKYGIGINQSVGFALAGTRSDTDISGNSKLEGDGIYVSAFAEQEINNLKFLAGISYQHSFYDSTRNVSNDYQRMSVDKKYEDDLVSIFAGGKYSYHLGNNFFAEPNVKLSVTHIMQGSIDEGDNGGLTIETDKKDFTFVEGEVGIDLVKKINLESGTLNLRAGTSLVYLLDGYQEEYLTGKITGSSKSFEMISPEDDRTKVKFTVGTEYEMTNGMFMSLHGNYTTSSHTEDYAVSFGAGYKF